MVRIQLSPARVRLLAAAMIASPLLILFGHLLTVSSDQSSTAYVAGIAAAGPWFYYVTAMMIATGALLLPLWAVGALALTTGRGGAFATAGAVCVTVAAFALGAGNFMFGAVMGALVTADRDIAVRVAQIADVQPIASVAWQLAPLLPIGLILVMIGLLRARTVPIWLAIVVAAGGVLVTFSGAGGLMTFLFLLPLGVGLAGVGVVLWRRAAAPASATEIVAEGALQAAH